MTLTLVAAVADNGVIGNGGDIPWRIPADFAHFKALTMGGVLIMGRATYDSIGRPLPGRTTIVVTRQADWQSCGVGVAHDLDEAIAQTAERPEPTYIVGGASIYEAALPLATHQVLTEVHFSPEGDTFYPAFGRADWHEVRRESHPDAEIPYEFVWWERDPAVK